MSTVETHRSDDDCLGLPFSPEMPLASTRVIGRNVCGNKYRIVVLVDYARHGMLIRFVGTHQQYDEIEDIEHI